MTLRKTSNLYLQHKAWDFTMQSLPQDFCSGNPRRFSRDFNFQSPDVTCISDLMICAGIQRQAAWFHILAQLGRYYLATCDLEPAGWDVHGCTMTIYDLWQPGMLDPILWAVWKTRTAKLQETREQYGNVAWYWETLSTKNTFLWMSF